MAGWIHAECGRVEPVRALVIRCGEPAGEPEEVRAPGKARARGIEQPLGVRDELAECLPGRRAELLRARRTMAGVVPRSELFSVGPCPPLRPFDGGAIRQREPGQLG